MGDSEGCVRRALEAENDVRIADFVVKDKPDSTPSSTMLSFNANLYPALRYAFVRRQ